MNPAGYNSSVLMPFNKSESGSGLISDSRQAGASKTDSPENLLVEKVFDHSHKVVELAGQLGLAGMPKEKAISLIHAQIKNCNGSLSDTQTSGVEPPYSSRMVERFNLFSTIKDEALFSPIKEKIGSKNKFFGLCLPFQNSAFNSDDPLPNDSPVMGNGCALVTERQSKALLDSLNDGDPSDNSLLHLQMLERVFSCESEGSPLHQCVLATQASDTSAAAPPDTLGTRSLIPLIIKTALTQGRQGTTTLMLALAKNSGYTATQTKALERLLDDELPTNSKQDLADLKALPGVVKAGISKIQSSFPEDQAQIIIQKLDLKMPTDQPLVGRFQALKV